MAAGLISELRLSSIWGCLLSGVQWDTTKENTMNVHNAMEISFTIEEKEEEIDGEKVVTWFQKR